MANLKTTEHFDFANFAPDTVETIGNNRQVTHLFSPSGNQMITGRLHGHTVFTLRKMGISGRPDLAFLCLDNCGYMTATTVSAVNDFLDAANINARVSRAKGDWTLTSNGKTYIARQGRESLPLDLIVNLVTGEVTGTSGWTIAQ